MRYFIFLQGLYHWYNNDLNEAIQYFNLVKYNPEWGQQALHNMVEINLIGFENCETANSLLQVCSLFFYHYLHNILPLYKKNVCCCHDFYFFN